ncbi:PadR family transcriptional regulator [Mycolicibacterium austroafricanum]|jgi:DNA-binding PadR family transcriptional regulator|uniref:PadR family transcriptional regulator n=1 Tax=Mycolicibacterium austroafricanum TaxID=39687 RepID=UPI00056665D1|nr:PadR family transcriptional regulator [Mycolicibacterium austroafricanum]QZY45740.1 PadR family transcriptional regulator [Mycolicibacterium austroafricanum]
MNTPFTPPENPFDRRGFGFGFDPQDRRAVHDRRRQARREFHDHVREHRGDAGFGPGFGGFGPGGGKFGPGFGFGPGGRAGRRGGPRGGGRSRRGDVRAAILKLLTDRPMHGYEMIQEIDDRSQQLWKPSPGSIYPTLQLLVDEGLLTAAETESSKKLFELTEDGRAAAEKIETAPWDEITEAFKDEAPEAMGLRAAVGQLMGAVAQSAHAATPEQQRRIVDIVNNARREVYQILGED